MSPPPMAPSMGNGNGSHSPFMVPQPAAVYSNVIVVNKKPKTQHEQHMGDYHKSSYPVMEPTVASSSSGSGNSGHNGHGSNYGKGEPELKIGTLALLS